LKKIKKLIVYSENYLPSIGGLENNTLLLCESLVSLGFMVTLLTPQKNALKHIAFDVIESSSLITFFNEIKKNDLLFVNGGVSFKIILPALIARKAYIIIYQMATLFNDIRNNALKTRVLNGTRKLLAFLALKNIGVSNYSFLELQQIFGKKNSALLTNPADPNFIEDTHLTKDLSLPFRCLFAGRLIDGKGIKLLIEAVHQINKDKELVQLHIVGDGPEKPYILEQTKANNYIIYHLPVSKNGLKNLLALTHLTVIPSTHHIEGSPLIMAESIIMGVPVLVSSQPAMEASICSSQLVFDSGDCSDLITRLKALTNPDVYQTVKKHCQQISEQYSYPNYLKQLKHLIDV
jgi:glycosyltransferase involved in cell wall biosynthesis